MAGIEALGDVPPWGSPQLMVAGPRYYGTFWGAMGKLTNPSLNEGREQAEAREGTLGARMSRAF